MDTAPGLILKTRSALFPLIVRTLAPGPRIVTSVVMLKALPSVMVPVTMLENTIVLPPPSALLSVIAWRNDPAPASLLL